MKPIAKFKAVYNPYLRHLVVKYGNSITEHTFEEVEEWCCINYNANEKHPNYLHIQLDYDETFQLLFYPRIEGDEFPQGDVGTYYNSGEKVKPRNIRIVHTDEQYDEAIKKLGEYENWRTTKSFQTTII
jgi:hypothetical protein